MSAIQSVKLYILRDVGHVPLLISSPIFFQNQISLPNQMAPMCSLCTTNALLAGPWVVQPSSLLLRVTIMLCVDTSPIFKLVFRLK